jgi:hypothetical protein
VGREEQTLFVVDLDDFLRQGQHIILLRASAQDDGEQFLVGKAVRSLFEELFSGAFGLGYVLNFFHGSLACISSAPARWVFAPFFRVPRALREAVFSSVSIFAFSSGCAAAAFPRFVVGILGNQFAAEGFGEDGLSERVTRTLAFGSAPPLCRQGRRVFPLPDDFFLLFEGREKKWQRT